MSFSNILLALHVFCGTVALLTGPIPMLAQKGGRLHRKAGTIYATAMGLGSLFAFVLAAIVHDKLLLTIAVLTAFLIYTGLRAAQFRRGVPRTAIDTAACLLLTGFSLWLLSQSVTPADPTGLFFATGSLVLVARQSQLERTQNPDWLLTHIAGMSGAYVATVTAFLVVNLSFLPKPVIFIVPTIIGTVFITWASVRHATRVAPKLYPGRS